MGKTTTKIPVEDNNVYYRNTAGRYVPIGVRTTDEYMTDGIWRVKHHEHSKQTTRMDYLAGCYKILNPKTINLKELSIIDGLENIYDEIIKSDAYNEILGNKQGYYPSDLIRMTLMYIYQKQNK